MGGIFPAMFIDSSQPIYKNTRQEVFMFHGSIQSEMVLVGLDIIVKVDEISLSALHFKILNPCDGRICDGNKKTFTRQKTDSYIAATCKIYRQKLPLKKCTGPGACMIGLIQRTISSSPLPYFRPIL